MKNIFFLGRTGNTKIRFHHNDISTLFFLTKLCVINVPIIPDRFNILNEDCEFKISPKLTNINELMNIDFTSFENCVEQRIKFIIDKADLENKNIYIMWSGGVDSTLIVSSFIKYGYKNIKILYNNYSVSEYPNFFEYINSLHIENFNFDMDIYNLKKFKNDIIINGNLGDFLECPTYEELANYYYKKMKFTINASNFWKDELFKMFNHEKTIDKHIDNIEEYSKKVNIRLKDFRTFHFMLMFCIKYTIGKNRLSFINDNYEDSIPFFDTLEFQKYALSKIDSSRRNSIYKYEWKKIINSVYKDIDFVLNKEKNVTYIGKLSNPGFLIYDEEKMYDFLPEKKNMFNILKNNVVKENYEFSL